MDRLVRDKLRRFYLWAICYRFREHLKDPQTCQPLLRIPDFVRERQEFRGKARASLTSSGVILGFGVAVVAGIVGSGESRKAIESIQGFGLTIAGGFVGVLLTCFVVRTEKWISACSVKKETKDKCRRRRSCLLLPLLGGTVFFFFGLPGVYSPVLVPLISKQALILAGLGLVILSVFFLFLAIEFYDSASGWRGGDAYLFHFASIASASYSFGLSLALVGFSLLLAFLSPTLARFTASFSLLVVVSMIEIARDLWDLSPQHDERSGQISSPSKPTGSS